jgi:chromosome segregation ATPase
MNNTEKAQSIALEVKSLNAELAPKSAELDRLYDEQNKLYDLIDASQKRVNEINKIIQDERYKTGKRSIKKEGLLTQVSDLRRQIESLNRISEIYLEA